MRSSKEVLALSRAHSNPHESFIPPATDSRPLGGAHHPALGRPLPKFQRENLARWHAHTWAGRRRRPLGSRVGQQQWMARAWPTTVGLNLPTAQTLLAEVTAMADRLLKPPGLGAGTCFQAVPFQCRMRARLVSLARALPPMVKPTAQVLLAEVVPTPVRSLPAAGLGLGTRAHLVPFQCRIRVWSLAPVLSSPTAQALLVEVAATSARSLQEPGLGLRRASARMRCSVRWLWCRAGRAGSSLPAGFSAPSGGLAARPSSTGQCGGRVHRCAYDDEGDACRLSALPRHSRGSSHVRRGR